MMGCLFGCFRASGDGGEVKGAGRGGGRLVSPSLAPATSHKVGLLAPSRGIHLGDAPMILAAVDEAWICAGWDGNAAARA